MDRDQSGFVEDLWAERTLLLEQIGKLETELQLVLGTNPVYLRTYVAELAAKTEAEEQAYADARARVLARMRQLDDEIGVLLARHQEAESQARRSELGARQVEENHERLKAGLSQAIRDAIQDCNPFIAQPGIGGFKIDLFKLSAFFKSWWEKNS